MPKSLASFRTVVFLWLGWFLALYAIQSLGLMRFEFKRPDRGVAWTVDYTRKPLPEHEIYLLDPFLNQQVAWDSEYYISIALKGYDDPAVDLVADEKSGVEWSKNYAFFPLYPLGIRLFSWALTPFTDSLTDVARATLAGVMVSLLGALAASISLYDILRDEMDESGRLRAVFYLLVFPSAAFLGMVYTEGFFIGIVFTALALNRRGNWFVASLVAALAPWTRAVGAALFVPLVFTWLLVFLKKLLGEYWTWRSPFAYISFREVLDWKLAFQGLFAFFPAISYFAWRNSHLGDGWEVIQQFFGRVEFGFQQTLDAYEWQLEHAALNPQSQVYFALEFFCLALAVLTCLFYLRKDPAIALFGLAVTLLSAVSGGGQGLSRYMLPVMPMYIVLARAGRNPVFDRIWTILSVFFMALSALLFAYDFWIG